MVRDSGDVWLGLQVQHSYGNPARDLGAVLEAALATEEPGIVGLTERAGRRPEPPGPDHRHQPRHHRPRRLRATGSTTSRSATRASRRRSSRPTAASMPTARLTSVEAAYWTNVGTKEHLRWVMPHPEDELLDALARLHAAGQDSVAEGSRFVGMFRAHGLLAPVWDLPLGTGAEVLEEPAATLRRRPRRGPQGWGPHRRRARLRVPVWPTVRSRSAESATIRPGRTLVQRLCRARAQSRLALARSLLFPPSTTTGFHHVRAQAAAAAPSPG